MNVWLGLVIGLLWLLATRTLKATAGTLPVTTAGQLEIIRAKYDLPALAVVVVKDGAICDRAAVGVRKWGAAALVTTNDLFHIGSCTKSMTATLTAMLIEAGQLRWDTTVAEVFPEWKGIMDRQYENVTVQQLLTQRSGLATHPPAAAWAKAWQKRVPPRNSAANFSKLF